jgi:two-component system NtrC family sensor kinase
MADDRRSEAAVIQAPIRPFHKLALRLFITATLIGLIPTYIFGSAIYAYFSHLQEMKLSEDLKTLAVNKGSAIELFLAERVSLLEILTRSNSKEQLTSPGALEKMFTLLNMRQRSFLDLGIVDVNGEHLAYVGPYQLEDKNYSDAQWFKMAINRGWYVSDVFLGFRGVPHFVIAVKQGEGKNAWVLRATIDSEVFNRLVKRLQLGEKGDAYIVNTEGRYQTQPRFRANCLDPVDFDIKSVPPGASVTRRQTPDGHKLLTAFAWLPKEDWLLVIDQAPSGAVDLAREFEIIILVLATLIIIGSAFFMVKTVVRGLDREDRQRAALDAELAHSARLVSLGRMASGVAHEINNPLAIISEMAGFVQDVVDQPENKDDPNYKLVIDQMVKIQDQVDRARDVTHRLLGFARRMEPYMEMVDINKLILEAFSFLSKEATFKGVEVRHQLASALPKVKTDRAQLQQVILNLIDNALDAVGEDGFVVIASRPDEDFIEVTVADNGPGIQPEKQHFIFDPFYTTKPAGEGTGLGLSISHSIMNKLGGSLTFKSVPGEGSTFYVRIPRSQD